MVKMRASGRQLGAAHNAITNGSPIMLPIFAWTEPNSPNVFGAMSAFPCRPPPGNAKSAAMSCCRPSGVIGYAPAVSIQVGRAGWAAAARPLTRATAALRARTSQSNRTPGASSPMFLRAFLTSLLGPSIVRYFPSRLFVSLSHSGATRCFFTFFVALISSFGCCCCSGDASALLFFPLVVRRCICLVGGAARNERG